MSLQTPQLNLAQVAFTLAAAVLAARVAWWIALERGLHSVGNLHCALFAFVVFGGVSSIWTASLLWEEGLQSRSIVLHDATVHPPSLSPLIPTQNPVPVEEIHREPVEPHVKARPSPPSHIDIKRPRSQVNSILFAQPNFSLFQAFGEPIWQTPPLTAEQLQAIQSGGYVYYFAAIIQDLETNEI